MKTRRSFLHDLTAAGVVRATAPQLYTAEPTFSRQPAEATHRAYWFSVVHRVAEPVLTNLATNKLRERMPVEAPRGNAAERRKFTYLEAFGRTLAGIAPWLGLQDKPAEEIELGKRFVELARQGLANATHPQSSDFMNFATGSQPLVDAAFLAQGILRSRRELWDKLDAEVQQRITDALQTRSALTAVMRRSMETPGTFDQDGWLRVGLAGHQPALGESYISTGSLYLCTLALLPMGLPATHPFWTEPVADWTSRKVWSGQDLPADHALKASD